MLPEGQSFFYMLCHFGDPDFSSSSDQNCYSSNFDVQQNSCWHPNQPQLYFMFSANISMLTHCTVSMIMLDSINKSVIKIKRPRRTIFRKKYEVNQSACLLVQLKALYIFTFCLLHYCDESTLQFRDVSFPERKVHFLNAAVHCHTEIYWLFWRQSERTAWQPTTGTRCSTTSGLNQSSGASVWMEQRGCAVGRPRQHD